MFAQTGYKDTGAVSGNTYYYSITAFNAAGDGNADIVVAGRNVDGNLLRRLHRYDTGAYRRLRRIGAGDQEGAGRFAIGDAGAVATA